jgi:uncharacterized protein YgiM (DUF1202 family)
MRKILFIPIIILTACSFQQNPITVVTPTVTPLPFATATLAPTFTPRPSATLAPPTIAPTIAPIMAVLTTQVNVRTSPDKKATSLGLLNYGSKVQVIGKDSSGTWWQIIYPENSSSTGWVSATYVQVPEAEVTKIPVAQPEAIEHASPTSRPGDTQLPLTAIHTPTPAGHTAKVKNQIFVRVGPGQTFESLGTVDAGKVVNLTGRNLNNVWIQIEFDGGAQGKGWVAAAYLEGADLKGLPYFDNQGNLLEEGTPAANPGQVTLTPTAFSPAAADGDSEQNPAVRLDFAPDGASEFSFSSDLSSPNGDTTDWVAFTPYEPTNQTTFVYIKLECSGNGGITATLELDGIPVPESKALVCGNYDFMMKVQGGKEYMLVLNADGSGGPFRYTRYNLNVKSER